MSQQERSLSRLQVFRKEISPMEIEFKNALPAHIPVERFMRVVMTAVGDNPQLLEADRRSLFSSCTKAAQDGLLPDGREGAIVAYKDHKANKVIAQWLPMIAGIRKKVRNSGEIATWDVHAVFEGDVFNFELGDEPKIIHKPSLSNRGKMIAVYSIATLKTGEKSRDVMSIEDCEKIRSKSKAKFGPWIDPIFYPEMCKKTVAKRHSKVLPMSTDLDDLIRQDDDLYDMNAASDRAMPEKDRSNLITSLDGLSTSGPIIEHDEETGELQEDNNHGEPENKKTPIQNQKQAAAPKKASPKKKEAEVVDPDELERVPDPDEQDEADPDPDEQDEDKLDKAPIEYETEDEVKAHTRGYNAFGLNAPRRMVPPEYRGAEASHLKSAWEAGHDEASSENR